MANESRRILIRKEFQSVTDEHLLVAKDDHIRLDIQTLSRYVMIMVICKKLIV